MKTLLLFSVLAVLFGCQQKPNLDAEVTALRKAAEEYQAKGLVKDFSTIKLSYSPDVTIMPPGAPSISGDGLDAFVNGFAQLKNFTISFSPLEISVDEGGTIGYSTATATMGYDVAPGRSDKETFRDFHVWKKQPDGSWRISKDIWNETDSGIEGVYEYLPPLKGMASVRNGTFTFLYGINDKAPLGEAGTYTLSGDTVKQVVKYSTDPKRIGYEYWWMKIPSSGDTLTYQIMNTKGEVVNHGRTLRISN